MATVLKIVADTSGLAASMEAAKGQVKSLAAAARDAGEELNKSSRSYLGSLEKQVKQQELAAATFGKSKSEIAAYRAALEGVSTTAAPMVARLKSAEDAIKSQAAAAANAATNNETLATKLRGLGAVVGLGVGAAVAMLGRELKQMATEALTSTDAFSDLSDVSGASIENISALDRLARQTGVNFGTVETSLVKFNKVLSDARPDSAISAALKSIGLSAESLRKFDPAESLRLTAVALSKYADDGDKARLVQELFGKSIKEVGPLLRDLGQQTELQATTTTAAAAAVETFNKHIFELKARVTDAARAIVSDMVPALNAFMKAINDSGPGLDGALARLREFAKLTGFGSGLKLIGVDIFGKDLSDRIKTAQDGLDATNQLLAAGGLTEERRIRLTQRRIDLERELGTLREGDGSIDAAESRRFSSRLKPSVPKVPDAGAAAAKISEGQAYLNQLQKQLDATALLTSAQRILRDTEEGRLKGMTAAMRAQAIATGAAIDQAQSFALALKAADDAQAEALRGRLADASAAGSQAAAQESANAALRKHNEEIGLSAEVLGVLERARVSSSIAIAEARLVTLESAGAIGAETWAVQDQIDAWKDYLKLLDERVAKEQSAADAIKAANADWSNGAKAAFKKYADESADAAGQTEKLFTNAFRGVGDAVADFVVKGEANFGKLAESILADLIRIEVQAIITAAVQAAVGQGGGGGGSGGGLLQALMGGGGMDAATQGSMDSGFDTSAWEPMAKGIDRVPRDGFRAVLHANERVLTASQAQQADKGLTVNVHNSAGAQVETKKNDDGTLDIFVRAAVAEVDRRIASGTGSTATAMKSRGLNLSGALPRRA